MEATPAMGYSRTVRKTANSIVIGAQLTVLRVFDVVGNMKQPWKKHFYNAGRSIAIATLILSACDLIAQQPHEFVRLANDFNPAPANGNPTSFLVSNDRLYFAATDGTHGIELWETDGTNVTRLTDLSYGSANSFISGITEFNGDLYFRGSGTTNGTINLELWKLSVADTNASLVAEINPT